MIRQTFDLPEYGWRVRCYYCVHGYHVSEIMNSLEDIGCRGKNLNDAYESLSSGKLDTGLTYSNKRTGETVIVIQITTTPKEFAKSWRHEMGHLATHIAEAYGIDPHGEEIQYIGDDIVEEMWDVAHHFLCEHCRSRLSGQLCESVELK